MKSLTIPLAAIIIGSFALLTHCLQKRESEKAIEAFRESAHDRGWPDSCIIFDPILEHSQLTTNTDTMKQCTLKFPKAKAAELAKFFAEHGIVTNLSWMESSSFFDN